MFCPNCNKDVGSALFCPSCGTKINSGTTTPEENASSAIPNTGNPGATFTGNTPAKPGILSKIPKKVLFAGVLVLALIIFIATRPTKINLNQFITIEFEGYQTLGRASITFESEKFSKKYSGKIKANKSKIKELYEDEFMGFASEEDLEEITEYLSSDKGIMEVIRSYATSGHFDSSSELSNGDKVIYQWDLDEEDVKDLESLLKIKLKYSDITEKVSGLEEASTFNPFDNITIEYSGISPNGRAEVVYDNTSDQYYSLYYEFDKRDKLSNGDEITVTVSINGSEENYVEKYGMIPSPTQQTFTVEGLLSYITTSEEIPSELLAQMQKQSEDHIRSYAARNWAQEATLKDVSYLGNYYLVNKNEYSPINSCYLVYKITCALDLETKDDGVITDEIVSYYYVGFNNLMTEANGTGAVDISSYSTPGNTFTVDTGYQKANGWGTYSFYFYGFENLDLLYNKIVTQNLENFTHEDNVTE